MENGGDPAQDLRGAPGAVVEMDLSKQDEKMSYIVSDKDVESMSVFDRLPSVQNNTQYFTEEANDPDDIYRPEGVLELEIDKFSEFVCGPADVQQRLSKPMFVRGLPWKILAIPKLVETALTNRDQNRCSGARTNKALGFFLRCNDDSNMGTWSCIASATLKVVNQNGGESRQRRITHLFNSTEYDWGYSKFLTCDQLLNPESGYIRNDMIRLEVLVSADAPDCVQWDSKKHVGYIGLKNQGATCYMNSLLQALYFTNQLRKALYEMPTEEDDSESSVALAMQRVFFDLQYSDKPVDTKKLTKSFGWNSDESFLQHDAQELCRVLLDHLQNQMKGTTVEDTIPHLFKGKMKSFIRCLNLDYESSHADDFYDVQLNVKGNNNILESFRDYVAPERLDGENKYDAGVYGLQPAEKGVKFLSFPPILHLQLMRFQYDAAMDANVKINNRLEFPERLDLNPFIEGKGEDEDYKYVLHAVLVHSGDFDGGHYVVFINTKLNQQNSCWCKFDDDVVSRSSFKDAVTANYGGEDPETLGRTDTNAYMLVYIRQSSLDKVLSPITDDDIPRHLRHGYEVNRSEEVIRKKEQQEAHTDTYNNLAIHTSELYNKIDIELVQNIENTQFLFQQIDITPPILTQIHLNWGVPELCNFIGKKINFDPERILLWKMSAYNEKPTNFLNDQQYRNFKVTDVLGLSGVNTHDPRRHKRYRLVYTKMPVPVADLENRKQMKIQMMDEKLNVSDITLFPPRHGTVGDLLEEAKREFKFAENGTGQLRLVYVGVSLANTRVFNVLENSLKISDVLQKTVNSSMYTARVEEIPKDQLRIGVDEHLMPVVHYDKEPTRMFGVPFLFKVSNRERFTAVHERLRQVLEVSEKEFEKYKFALLLPNKGIYPIDLKEKGKFVHLNTLSASGSMPLLGIDHLNKSRGARSGHITGKPIIIHN